MKRPCDYRRSVFLESAFPDNCGAPFRTKQRLAVGSIPSHVGIELRLPEGGPRGGGRGVGTSGVAMPEASVDETDGLEPREHDVWCAGEPAIVQSKPEATSVESAAKRQLRQRVAASDSRHHARAGSSVHYVRHSARFG